MKRARILDEERIEREKPTQSGRRRDVHDGEVANLVVRVGTRRKVFVLMTRFPGDVRTTRRKIGEFPKISLEAARATARAWNELIKQGIDPAEEKTRTEREKRLEERRVFRSALVDFISWLPDRRYTRHVLGDIAVIRRTLLDNPEAAETLTKPVAEVTREDLGVIIENLSCRTMSQAYLLFKHLQAFFRWVKAPLRCGHYGILVDPLEGLNPEDLELWKNARLHVLEPWELRAYWQAAEEMPYPYGPYFKVLLLIAERRTAVAGMRWSELDPATMLWRAPPIRVKGKLVEHLVPLSDQLMELLADIHRSLPPGHGDYVFSSSHGQSPIKGFGGATNTLRAKAEAALREIDSTKVMRHFVLHDDRRVDRTALSALDVPSDVAEGILNHSKKGIEGLYDQYRQIPQRRKAMAKLHDRLGEVVEGSKGDFWDDEPAGGSWEEFHRPAQAEEAEQTTQGRRR
ncbi:integrase arm-type DNA-binding domain-containing protein [Rhizobium calliandrae]|uniref:Integrase arm-type DNA-binding domain-containing protein n=1 Tax=Rhizobium calliandrae TaxID=1312182 RepID=A0ABT7KQA4_9HYPH|nr:integrase arm-type DNA-binding domain-containing protein [Rhizobium calliandrae]MDL2410829.1 integrase arm-type DNA-binding domain-containing protein [Rhizobium calliandrae]